MALMVLDHFLIRASDIEATKAFYTDVLGLKEGWRAPLPFPGHWLYLGEVSCVHLVGKDKDAERSHYLAEGKKGAPREHGSGTVDHIAFRAKELEAFIEHLEALRISYRKRGVEGLVQIFVEDPNGITIELNFDAPEV